MVLSCLMQDGPSLTLWPITAFTDSTPIKKKACCGKLPHGAFFFKPLILLSHFF
jgi:hypothetical protein